MGSREFLHEWLETILLSSGAEHQPQGGGEGGGGDGRGSGPGPLLQLPAAGVHRLWDRLRGREPSVPQSGPGCSQSRFQVSGDLKANWKFFWQGNVVEWHGGKHAGKSRAQGVQLPDHVHAPEVPLYRGYWTGACFSWKNIGLKSVLTHHCSHCRSCWTRTLRQCSKPQTIMRYLSLFAIRFETLCISGDRSETDLWEELDEEGDHL